MGVLRPSVAVGSEWDFSGPIVERCKLKFKRFRLRPFVRQYQIDERG